MKKSLALVVLFFIGWTTIYAQKDITLEDIWNDGTFSQEYLEALRSLKNGEEYAILKSDRKQRSVHVDAFSYKTGEKTATLIDSKAIEGLDYFQSYQFNKEE